MEMVSIIKEIEFAPEYRQAGASLLNYFSTFFHRNNPEVYIQTELRQDNEITTLRVETHKEFESLVRNSLKEYGELVQGNISEEGIDENSMHLLELKNELNLAQMKLQHQQAMLELERKKHENSEALLKNVTSSFNKEDESLKSKSSYNENIKNQKDQINKLSQEIKEQESLANKEISGYKKEIEKTQNELEQAKEELVNLQLGKGVDGAIDAISKSISDTDKAISRSVNSSNLFSFASLFTYGLSLLLLINLFYLKPETVLANVSIYFYVFPVVATFLIATALLKHDANLRQQYLTISKQKNSLEKATGILEASRHLGEVKDLNPLVHESFSIIRLHLLKDGVDPSENNEEKQSSDKAYENIIASLIKGIKVK